MSETAQIEKDERIVKVKMTAAGFDPEHGKMRVGGVYEFPQEQAVRYVRKGVAKPAPGSAKTAREEDAERRQEEYKARPSAQVLDQEMSSVWDIDADEIAPPEWEDEAKAAAVVTVKPRRGQAAPEPPVFNEAITR